LEAFGKPESEVDPANKLMKLLAGHRLVIASNRGPVSYSLNADGSFEAQRGSGGVTTALTAACRFVPVTWIASAMSEGDRRAAQLSDRLNVPYNSHEIGLRFVVSPQEQYHRYYNIISNPLLWFLQHYMWDTPYTPNISADVYEAWHKGYVPVNEAFARAVATEAADGAPSYIMLHDYHLYLVPGMLKKLLPNSIVQHFIHIPWPTYRYWLLLPSFMRLSIIESLCEADIIGLQTMRDVRSFLFCCEELLPEAKVDLTNNTVYYKGHETKVRNYPIAIDTGGLEAFAESPQVLDCERYLRRFTAEKTIVRVDRMEPSKNALRGFGAFDTLLRRRPDLRGKVSFLSFLVPSRTGLSLYQSYAEEVFGVVEALNDDYGTPSWQPIKVFYEENYAQAVAAMKMYDALLVNPIIDGMNLVAKEGPLVNKRDGVLILSEMAGAFEQLGRYSLPVAPTDVEGTSRALEVALEMSPDEKRKRLEGLRDIVHTEDIVQWLEHQLEDVSSLRPS
jgi:trehalose 6-phosphate synthase